MDPGKRFHLNQETRSRLRETISAIRALLAGEKGPYRNIAVFNAAAALMVADKANDLRDGVKMAQAAIDSGAAKQALGRLIAITNENDAANSKDAS